VAKTEKGHGNGVYDFFILSIIQYFILVKGVGRKIPGGVQRKKTEK